MSRSLRRGGMASEGTRHTLSPDTPSGSRLVASTRSSGSASSSSATRRAEACATCSQLSSTSRVGASTECSPDPRRSVLPCSSTPRTALVTDSWSELLASSTHHTPPGYRSMLPAPRAIASRLLPIPPLPVSVTHDASASRLPSTRKLLVTSDQRRVHDRQIVPEGFQRAHAPAAPAPPPGWRPATAESADRGLAADATQVGRAERGGQLGVEQGCTHVGRHELAWPQYIQELRGLLDERSRVERGTHALSRGRREARPASRRRYPRTRRREGARPRPSDSGRPRR